MTEPSPLAILVIEALVAFMYMTSFIALSIFLSKPLLCHGGVCGVARADTVFTAFCYLVWAASATITGIKISRHADSRVAINCKEAKIVATEL